MNKKNDSNPSQLSGDELIKVLEALSNPHRLRIIALLVGRRVHVSQLAREAQISRPLLYMHLKRLQEAGLVSSKMELSEDGKAMNVYELTPFSLHLTPESISKVADSITIKKPGETKSNEKGDKE